MTNEKNDFNQKDQQQLLMIYKEVFMEINKTKCLFFFFVLSSFMYRYQNAGVKKNKKQKKTILQPIRSLSA